MDDFMTNIGEIAQIFDGPHATPVKTDEGPIFLSISSLDSGRLDLTKSARLSDADFKKWTKRVTPQEGDLLFSYETRLGEAALMPSGVTACLGRRMGLLRPRLDKIVPEYLLYAYLSPAFQQTIVANTITGATVDRISLNELPDFPIRIPRKEVQKKVADLLKTIDAKIECNNRINAELEAMAKTLYEYWFVQFEYPDANGKPYKSSGGKMVYNATLKREIPTSWQATTLASITPISNDSLNPRDFLEKEFKHFSIPVFDATNTYGIERGDIIGSNKFRVIGRDLLVSKLNPWFSRVIYAMDEEDQICSTELVVWRCPTENIKNFLYLIATSQQFISHCVQSATGTSNSHKRVNPAVMMRFEIPYSPEVAEEFGGKISSIVKKLIINRQENQQLSQLRDWLLPLLMNGQVTVA
ncbi:MAG: restriction endonuclease subunit S [Limnohabitans sp.]|jgi:type I restriction enzyme S subunit|uniref:restriction endonuclease subunit S n=1 Tax=Limnohabitans sp. TaxID=1907725 RepID=UPI003918E5B3